MLGFLSRLLAAAPEAKISRAAPLLAFANLGRPLWSERETRVLAEVGFRRNPIVHRAVRLISETAASMPLTLFRGEEEITSHPLLDLLAKPNPRQAGEAFLEALYVNLMVAGNCYVEQVSAGNAPGELYLLRPDRMQVVPGPNGWPEAYDYRVGAQMVRYQQQGPVPPILHLAQFDPLDDYYGLPPLSAAQVSLDVHNAASAWNKSLLDNAARPSGALVYSADGSNMTDEQFQRLKDELETNFQGATNAGRPILLEGGLDWKPLSMTPKDMDFLEAKNTAAREIALAFGVPPLLLGLPGDNTLSNYAEANRAFWRTTIIPLVGRTMRSLAAWLGPAYGESLRFEPDVDRVEALSDERAALWKRVNDAGFLTEDEKRVAVGYGAKVVADAQTLAGKLLKEHWERRFNPNHDALGLFASGPGGAARHDGVMQVTENDLADPSGRYGPEKFGWHDYKVGPNLVCGAELKCSREEMADQLSRFSVPGQDPARPVESGQTYSVYDPRTGAPGGQVVTSVTDGGLTVTNQTLPEHLFYDGVIVRQATQAADGSWYVTTHGFGNNVIFGFNEINQSQGPKIFETLDQRLRGNIERHHGQAKAQSPHFERGHNMRRPGRSVDCVKRVGVENDGN